MRRIARLAHAAAAAAYVAPLLLLAADGARILGLPDAAGPAQRLALALLVPAIVGVAFTAGTNAQWQVTMGAGLAAAGAAAMARWPETLAAPTRVPAVLLPVGLLILSSAMVGSAVSRRAAALLGAGAILFPMAHLAGVPAALLGADVVLVAAFWALAPGRGARQPV